MNGYFEWDESNPSKIRPYLIKSQSEDGTLYLACLYNNAFKCGPAQLGEQYNHFVVLTMNAAENLSRIHHRMPVFLTEETKKLWLDPDAKYADCFKAIMKSKVYEGLTFEEVGTLVNSVIHDGPEIIMPKAQYEELLHQRGLGRFFVKASQQPQEEESKSLPEVKSEPKKVNTDTKVVSMKKPIESILAKTPDAKTQDDKKKAIEPTKKAPKSDGRKKRAPEEDKSQGKLSMFIKSPK